MYTYIYTYLHANMYVHVYGEMWNCGAVRQSVIAFKTSQPPNKTVRTKVKRYILAKNLVFFLEKLQLLLSS